VLVIKRIHVKYVGLTVPDEQRDTVQRVLEAHVRGCPVARSLEGAIEVTVELDEGG